MKTRRMAKLAVMAAALLASPYARAATTNDAPMEALLAVANNNATTTTNGWTLTKLNVYNADHDCPVCLKFGELNDMLVSPYFGAPIHEIDLGLRCSASNNATRLLYVRDTNGVEKCVAARLDSGNTYKTQEFLFDEDADFSQFKIVLEGSGNTGNWGIGSLKIVFDFDAPSNLQVPHNRGDWCRLSWENCAGTVSNRVETFSIERGEGDEVLFETGFDEFEQGKNGTSNYTDRVAEMLGEAFSGTNVLGAASTNGICQLGTPDEKGFLRHAGLADYSNVELRLVLKRYKTKDEAVSMQIAYEANDMMTVFAMVDLPEDFEERVVDLGMAPSGSSIYIGYYDRKGGNRRVLIDSMSIVRTHPDTLTPVDSRWIPASPGAASFSTRDYGIELLPKSEYRFEVRAKTAGVLVSDPAAVDVILDSLPGFRFILR